METKIIDPLTVFGEVLTTQMTAVAQVDAVYGLRSKTDVEVFTDGSSGSVDVTDSTTGKEFRCQTGTTVGGYGLVRCKRQLKYRPGSGMVFRYTARFSSPAKDGAQRAGPVGVGTELSFGYDGLRFGILHRTGGKQEIRTLTISAAGNNDTLSVTLNGTAFPVVLSSATTTKLVAKQIAATSFTGWYASHNGSTVIFISTTVGAKTGTYSLSSNGTAAGTFAQTGAGIAVVDSWTYKENWNAQPGFPIDPQKGNVFQIKAQYLGYGSIEFYIEDKITGRFVLVHQIQYANANTGPSLYVPSMATGVFAASLGSTTNLITYSASMASFIEGQKLPLRNPYGKIFSKSSVGTTLTNILSIRVRRDFAGIANLSEMFPLNIDYAVDGTKPAECYLYLNPTVAGNQDWTYIDQTNSVCDYDTAGTTVTEGSDTQLLHASGVSKDGVSIVGAKDLDIRLEAGDVICLAVKATSGTTDVTASISWQED